ncbi:right-handed parallel beta-helix repeat-containing protein [uncultured Brevundimonas sp.]|uniref:right-handed parallel beta-helix repeat-containing protein n=1 Tax=uncultured Brevundimonas sp. TaxID=213418 RepID=UPI0025F2F8B0|nr:right-handed parallel beta-helix repeat-containing protein [uncultured Brevundimonas sp.]
MTIVYFEDFGAVGDNATDDTAAIRAAFAAAPAGAQVQGKDRKTYVITDTLFVDKQVLLEGNGSWLRYEWRANKGGIGFCRPMMVLRQNAARSRITGLNFNHDALDCPGATLAPDQPGGNDGLPLVWQCALILQGDEIVVSDCRIDDAWDNAFTIGRYFVTGEGTSSNPYKMPFANISVSEPKRVTVDRCLAVNAGLGKHYYPTARLNGGYERVGGGFNNLNGANATFSNCVARECSTGFISDYGAQASTRITDCTAFFSRSWEGGTGWGYWLADGANIVSSSQALFCVKEGFVIPYEANGTILDSCFASACGYDGFYIASNRVTLTGCISQANGQANDVNRSAAFRLVSYDEALDDVVMIGNLALPDGKTQYGLVAVGLNPIRAQWIGGSLSGVAEAYSIGIHGVAITQYRDGPELIENSRRTLTSTVASGTIGEPWNRATLELVASGGTSRLALGFNGPDDSGVVQAINPGIVPKPLKLNPGGGEVWAQIDGIGLRKLVAGAADSAGKGFRTLRTAN